MSKRIILQHKNLNCCINDCIEIAFLRDYLNPWFWFIIPRYSSNQHYSKRETGGLPLTAVKFKVNHVCDCGLLHFFHMPILHKILHAFFRILVLKKYFFIIFKKIMKKVFWFVGWAFSGAVLIFFPFQSKFESLI